MGRPLEGLTEQQVRALTALARGRTREEAAKEAGVCERTIYYWLQDPLFRSGLEELQQTYFRALLAGLSSAALNAVRYLNSVVTGKEAGDALRIRAATALLSSSFNLVRRKEEAEESERLKALEAVLRHRNGKE